MGIYLAYGLRIESELPLPELVEAASPADVTIRRAPVDYPDPKPTGAGGGLVADTDEIRFWIEGVGTFLVRAGRSILVDATPDTPEELLRPTLLGPALGLLLHQRGFATFHGSSVSVHGRAAIFLGPKGSGKSTLAAALNARGHPLLADDISAVDSTGGRPHVLPSYPLVKLWPDSAKVLRAGRGSLRRLHRRTDKLVMRPRDGAPENPVPLGCVYILAPDASDDMFEQLRPPTAILKLLPHWYAAMSGLPLIRALGVSVHFRQCAEITESVPVFQLASSGTLADVGETARRTEGHFQHEVPDGSRRDGPLT